MQFFIQLTIYFNFQRSCSFTIGTSALLLLASAPSNKDRSAITITCRV